MAKNKAYSKVRLKNALKKIKPEDLDEFRFHMNAGSSVIEISKRFQLSYAYATILFLEFSVHEKRYQKVMGSKTEPYYHTEDGYQIPEYRIQDLKNQELKIYKRLEDGKDERTLYRDNGEE